MTTSETGFVEVDHSDAVAWTELYAKRDGVPTPGDFDFAFAQPGLPDQIVVLPFTEAGQQWELEILGFSTDGGNTITTQFMTQENAANSAQLYASLTAVPEPSSFAFLGLLGLSCFFRRWRNQRFA